MDDCVSPSENNTDTQVDMSAKRTYEQVVDWLKAAQKRQQEWQQEVKQRWAAKQQSASASTTIEGQGFYAAIIVENRNPLLTNITADFDQTAVMLTNKPSE